MRDDAKKALRSQNKEATENKSAAAKQVAAEKAKENEIQTKADLKQLQSYGIVHKEQDIDALYDSLKEVQPIYKINKGEDDKIDNKILAIIIMEGTMREYQGEMKPNYTLAGKLVGRSKSYMHKLWADRAEITANKNTLIDKGLEMVQVKLIMTTLKMTQALDQVENWSEFLDIGNDKQTKNFIDLFDKLLLRIRLLGGMSTENVAHKHDVGGRVTLVAPDDA